MFIMAAQLLGLLVYFALTVVLWIRFIMVNPPSVWFTGLIVTCGFIAFYLAIKGIVNEKQRV